MPSNPSNLRKALASGGHIPNNVGDNGIAGSERWSALSEMMVVDLFHAAMK